MTVRIYQPAKTAMQSGKANTQNWILEFSAETPRPPEPLMGWTAAGDTNEQVRLFFESKEEAVAYATNHSLIFVIHEPKRAKPKIKAYADNFAYRRIGAWTH